jgi:hypothetical protein
VDPSGNPSEQKHSWKVSNIKYATALEASDLQLGEEYEIYDTKKKRLFTYSLNGVSLGKDSYFEFEPLDSLKANPFKAFASQLPSIHPKGTKHHDGQESITFESVLRDADGAYTTEEIPFVDIAAETFITDVGNCHVASCIGKGHGSHSKVHFTVTTAEPYGVCCLSGLKVSLGMHNFGTRRWRWGFLDDIRSPTDQNTRVIGDFTKSVNSTMIIRKMYAILKNDKNWRMQFEKVVNDLDYEKEMCDIWVLLLGHVEALRDKAPFERSHLQTRFFECGDNFYLGMEFPREYDRWKTYMLPAIMAPVLHHPTLKKDENKLKRLKFDIGHKVDRLWYFSTLEVIRGADVYNPGGKSVVPILYLVDSLVDQELSSLPEMEAFRLVDDPRNRFELLVKPLAGKYVVRDVEGYISLMSPSTKVRLGGN